MDYHVLHESKHRIRLHLPAGHMYLGGADALSHYLNQNRAIKKAHVNERTGNVILYPRFSHKEALRALRYFELQKSRLQVHPPEHNGRETNRYFRDQLTRMLLLRGVSQLCFPPVVGMLYTLYASAGFLKEGLRSLSRKKLDVNVLDATSIAISLVRRDFASAGNITFLLRIAELLEQWTRKKTIADLAQSLALNIDHAWLVDGDQEVAVPVSHIHDGDTIRVQTGSMIPLDATVISGEAMINQSSMTGESLSVHRSTGATVYAGTVIEEGTLLLQVNQPPGKSRYDEIVAMIQKADHLKSATESNALQLADRLVPYSFAGALVTYLLTRSVTKALSVLMVDFSCALKLSIPLSVLSAMREAGQHGITVKGGKFLEAVSNADVIVFDKTGTLTHASPKVADIIPFGGHSAKDVLRIAACLEEHFPHSIANAVVNEAKKRQIFHDEMHSEVEYVVAHGISSRIDGKKAIIGSRHFVFEDEKCTVPSDEQDRFDMLTKEYSHLYLAIGGQLAGVLFISDPLRSEAGGVISQLKSMGIKEVVMMTGDNEHTASAIAKQLRIDSYDSEVLPEDKANLVMEKRNAGHTVIMVGDGINDAPSLSTSNVGIAISEGAALAREIADITITADHLSELVILKKLSDALTRRIRHNYRFVLAFNSGLLALGILGILMPTQSAFLHNFSTVGISIHSMRNLLK